MKLDWTKICSEIRLSHVPGECYDSASLDQHVEQHHKNIERIITSTAFRRLQGKTQVYPFPENDSLRNRLTHTLEVSYIGRTITTLAVSKLSLEPNFQLSAPAVVNSACLLHDIGNPPFGHSGEESIREFFKDNAEKFSLISKIKLTDFFQDFVQFDGNAQGFRIATKLSGWRNRGGMRLTAASLAAMVKYPYASSDERAKGKFGFMQSDRVYFDRVFAYCGLKSKDGMYMHHPFAPVVEAADDIAYLTSDMQDAFRYGDIKFDDARTKLNNLASGSMVEDQMKEEGLAGKEYQNNYIDMLRSSAVSNAIFAVKDTVANRLSEESLMEPVGKFSILKESNLALEEREIRKIMKTRAYRGTRKMQLQVAGGRIIKSLLEIHVDSFCKIKDSIDPLLNSFPEIDKEIKDELTSDESIESLLRYVTDNIEDFVTREAAQVFLLMPEENRRYFERVMALRFCDDNPLSDEETCYEILLNITDFISGMTDDYITSYHEKMTGIGLAS